MANLKEVRVRIASVNSTQQITKAMKMVSAAKLRRAQDAIIQMRPYATKLKEILSNCSGSIDTTGTGIFTKVRPVQNVLIVAVTSNRGLAGAFNSNVIRTVNKLIAGTYADLARGGHLKVFCIGKKGSDYFSKTQNLFAGHHNEIFLQLNFANVSAVALEIMDGFAAGKYDEVVLVYNQFKNAAVQYVITEQMLPIAPPEKKKDASRELNDYIFEPSQAEIMLDLIPKTIKTQLFKAVLDSHASEHGARMTAMSKATDNAGDLIKELKLQYNKARQAAITNEILEIVAGAEALSG